jgi:hypothetical protein
MNIFQKPSILLRLALISIPSFLIGALVGPSFPHAANPSTRMKLDDAVVSIEKYGPGGVAIKQSGQILAVAIVWSEGYKVIAHAAGSESVITEFDRGNRGPNYIGLWAQLKDGEYLVKLNSEGEEIGRIKGEFAPANK